MTRMGLFQKCGSVHVAVYREMEVEAARAWEILVNIDEFPKLFKRVDTVKRMDGSKPGDPFFVGMKWAEIRHGKYCDAIEFTVTHLDTGEGKQHTFPRSVSFMVEAFVGYMSTSTVQVDRISDHRCIFKETTAFIPNSICARLMSSCYYCPLQIYVRRRVQTDLIEICNYLEGNPTKSSTSSSNNRT
eukprot:CAMPEP_0198281484 /NCGR_PEP_ID=MMETSP1449-20131203/1409_1 /TAXON_ID=420275 /ORGANISM="Attheya septentrionalis, Strain CCMP2084" /LENGTH=186 /DNA_ID=CAMNT_0043977267 /DNA_START=75 /DNA_END=631 /DNA_ORIENTATION=+